MDEQTIKRDLIRVCHLMYERSYVVSSDGNVSVRLDDGRILATPTMTCKGRMTEDLIAITDLEGRALNDRKASSELAMQASLKATLDCATAFATTDFRTDLVAFQIPTLIIHGTGDKTVPIDATARRAAAGIPGSILREYDGAPHGLLASHKNDILADIMNFLRNGRDLEQYAPSLAAATRDEAAGPVPGVL